MEAWLPVNLPPVFALLLFLLITTALVTDLLHARIYNWLTFPMIAAGIILQGYYFGPKGCLSAVTGTILGFTLLLPGGLMGFVGAGDLKLQAAIGSLMGNYFILWVFLLSSLVAPLYALPLFIKNKGVDGITELYVSLKTGNFRHKKIGDRKDPSIYLHGVAIFFGTLLAYYFILIKNWVPLEKILQTFGMGSF